MGKGDQKTKKGKIAMGSFGKTRRRKKNQSEFLSQQTRPNTDKKILATEAATPEQTKKAGTAKKSTTKKSSPAKTKAKASTAKASKGKAE